MTIQMNKKSWVIAAVILVAVIVIAAILHHKKITQPSAIPPVTVRAEHPAVQSIPATVVTTGYLVAEKSTTITPRAPGYIQSIEFHEGQAVQSGQVLFQLDNQVQKEALTAAQASYALSKLQYDRDVGFLKKGFITQDMFYSAKVALKQNEATLETAKTNYAERQITAPFSGTVGAIATSIGDYINPGNALTTLVDNKHLRVEYTMPVKKLNQLKLNQNVTITDATEKNKITAVVSYISPRVNQSTQTIGVHARIDNTTGLFKPGEYVTITQNLGAQKNALLVPEESVLASINGYAVFLAKDNKAVRVPITIGDRINGKVVITSGISAKDQVIIAGENEVKSNQPIVVKSP
jgi:membrane fusion protein (multidrug efflux system)